MWMLHSMARMMPEVEPSLDQRLASLKCPATMSLSELMNCYTMMMNSSKRRHWGHIVRVLGFSDRFRLSKQGWNVDCISP